MRFLAVIVLLAALTSGCQPQEEPSIYLPGGDYAQRLDARGRRYIVRNAADEVLCKVRDRRGELRVYSAQMLSLGFVSVDAATVTVSRDGEETTLQLDASPVVELKNRFRVEEVDQGWAVFDRDAQRLGYFQWTDGRLALRDDYSSAPRLAASVDAPEARTPAGKVELSISPERPIAPFMAFAVDGKLDELDRVVLGMWLQGQHPQ